MEANGKAEEGRFRKVRSPPYARELDSFLFRLRQINWC